MVGRFHEGDDYAKLLPAYSVWLLDGVLWRETPQVHHAFQLTDAASGRVLDTLAIHTLELPKYNSKSSDLTPNDPLGWWLYWLRHAPDYEADALLKAFPQQAMRRASESLIRISQISEDKAMYDARERAIRDRQWKIDAARNEGEQAGLIKGEQAGLIKGEQAGLIKGEQAGLIKGEQAGLIKGKIETIRMLQGLLYLPLSDEQELMAMGLEQLELLASGLQEKLRGRKPS